MSGNATSDRQTEYREVYLRSDHWHRTREQALDAAEHRCAICNASKHLDVHHRTYERLGSERPADLLVLCRVCHEIFHSKGRLAGSKAKSRPKLQKAKKAKPSKPRAAKKPKGRHVALGRENDRLHALQKQNKIKQRLVREGRVSPALRAGLADRHLH